MLIIENLRKEYVPKKGVPVVAIDGINLTLGDTGVVFLLGKSGSGKSTLLHLIGGLDVPTSGSFTIAGNNSKDFKSNNYDAYRNTYVGFVFQEYNILEEFSVGANIGLALELQGKKATAEDINKILEQVDLVGLADRKPNELSGGQKQRVAIARALIKDPQIIMADEPTGALDSNTGRAIFETLQKLGKDKLVIVVSHDRENAELYADRIIELADGKVISDETKHTDCNSMQDVAQKKFTSGHVLSEEDLALIDAYIAGGNKAKSANYSFSDTTNEDIVHQKGQSGVKMIASSLPISKAFKMGISPLRAKPIRLMFTIFLCLVSFTMFGLMDTGAMFNYVDAYYDLIATNDYTNATIVKYENKNSSSEPYYYSSYITTTELAELQEDLGLTNLAMLSKIGYLGVIWNDSNFYTNTIYNCATANVEQLEALGLEVTGEAPTSDDEIMLSYYMFEGMQSYGTTFYEMVYDAELDYYYYDRIYIYADNYTMQEFLALDVYVTIPTYSDGYLKITGFFDTGLQDDAAFDTLKSGRVYYNSEYYNAEDMLKTERSYGLSCAVIVSETLYDEILQAQLSSSSSGLGDITIYSNSDYISDSSKNLHTIVYDNNCADEIVYFDSTSLNDGEILISESWYWDITEYVVCEFPSYFTYIENDFDLVDFTPQLTSGYVSYSECKRLEEYKWLGNKGLVSAYLSSANLSDEELGEIFKWKYNSYNSSCDLQTNYLIAYKSILFDNYGILDFSETELTAEQIIFVISYYSGAMVFDEDCMQSETISNLYNGLLDFMYDILVANISEILPQLNLKLQFDDDDETTKFDIVGLTTYGASTVVTNSNFYEEIETEPMIYRLFVSLPETEDELKALLSLGIESGEDSIYKTVTWASLNVENASSTIEKFLVIFLYAGIGFAIVSILMMYNFMSVSINYKRNEIGILRAIGSKSSDIFKIFFAESLVISVINFVLACVATTVLSAVFNNYLASEVGVYIKMFMVSARQFALIFGISILTALIACYFPVKRIASQSPIDAIRCK